MAAKKITVRVTLDIEIDPETWEVAYGDSLTSKAAANRAVREYAWNQVAQSNAADAGAIVDVTETHKS